MPEIPFNKLKEGDFIYQLNPFTLEVEGMKVKELKGVVEDLVRGKHPNAYAYKHAMHVIYYRRELVLHSPDLDKVPTVDLIVDGRATSTLMHGKIEGRGDILYPIPIATSKELLEQWMGKR